jgi:hypothetical protein
LRSFREDNHSWENGEINGPPNSWRSVAEEVLECFWQDPEETVPWREWKGLAGAKRHSGLEGKHPTSGKPENIRFAYTENYRQLRWKGEVECFDGWHKTDENKTKFNPPVLSMYSKRLSPAFSYNSSRAKPKFFTLFARWRSLLQYMVTKQTF